MLSSRQILLIGAILFMSCSINSQTITQESYRTIKLIDGKDCEMYVMMFQPRNDYLFRIALSGPCESLNEENYLDSYKSFIKSNLINANFQDSIKIIVEAYGFNLPPEDSLKSVTENQLKVRAEILESWDEGIKMKLIK